MKTQYFDGSGIPAAAEIIRAGGLVAVPTETVYGLAADAQNEEAVKKIFAVKSRPEEKRINLLVPGIDAVCDVCANIPESAYILAKNFWPGPLTMILLRNENVPDIVTDGGETVGVRCPAHPVTLELLNILKRPLAAPSANITGQKSPVTADEVKAYFNGKIEAIIDGGRCTVGVESTILDLTVFPPKILRQGGLAKEKIDKALGIEVMV